MGDPATVTFSQFLDEADTGDVVIWQGTSLISLGVELATFSHFSHTTMVIRDPDNGDKYLFQSVSESLAADPLTKPPGSTHSGVQAGPLEQTMELVFKAGDFPSWRQLDWPDRPAQFDAKMWQIAQGIDGTPFPWVDGDTYKSVAMMLGLLLLGREMETPVLKPIFCSGLVAFMLQQTGVIQTTMPPNGYEPKDFSSTYPGVVHTCPGVSFNTDVWVMDIPPPSK
ncbi:MAG: hypothetical protein WAS51_11055 [Ilumatobacteraceae bacterium]|nr:MAG: hypothetical protein IPM43_05210 [Actinomycetota bacterium]